METDRISAWFDKELDKTELDAFCRDISAEECMSRYEAYRLMQAAIQGKKESLDYQDYTPAMLKLLSALDQESIVEKTWQQRLKELLPIQPLVEAVRFHWMPLGAALTVVFGVVFFYPNEETHERVISATQGTQAITGGSYPVIRATATQLGVISGNEIDDYISAHEGVSIAAAFTSGGLGSLRSIVHSDKGRIMQQ